jgi:hypothetical protein
MSSANKMLLLGAAVGFVAAMVYYRGSVSG